MFTPLEETPAFLGAGNIIPYILLHFCYVVYMYRPVCRYARNVYSIRSRLEGAYFFIFNHANSFRPKGWGGLGWRGEGRNHLSSSNLKTEDNYDLVLEIFCFFRS